MILNILILFFSFYANADMQFEGVNTQEQQYIKKMFYKNIHNNMTSSEVDEIIKYIYQTSLYEKVRAYRKNETIIIHADPLKKISEISVNGNSHFGKSDILKAFNVNTNDLYIQQSLYEGAESIKEFYGKRGYFNAVVTVNPKVSPDGQVGIRIEITENTPCQIKEINFITENESLKAKLLKQLKQHLNKSFSEDTLSDIESELKEEFINSKLFSAILVGPTLQYNKDKTSASLVYIIENPYSYIFFFDGQKAFSSNEIINKLEINTQNQFGSNPTAELTTRIRKLYEDNGYSLIKVNTSEKINAQDFTRKIFFTITEGDRTHIKEIQIRGNFSKDPKFYKDIIMEHASSLIQNNYYNIAQLKLATDNLLIELQNRGYLQAKILSTQANYSENKKSVNIIILLEEGPLTKIGKINLTGLAAFSKLQLLNVINLKEGQPLKLSDIENSIQKITDFYKSNGYMDMRVTNQTSEILKYNESHTLADLEISIIEGPKVTVGGIIVEGNDYTKEYVILKELNFTIGDVLTPELISDSEFNLQKTGLFSQVAITQLEVGTSIPQRNIIVKVSEREPGLFNFGLGISNEFALTVRGFTEISYKNLGGSARAIRAKIDIKRVTDINFVDHRLSVGYYEPFVFNSLTRGRINLIRAREILSRSNLFSDGTTGILGAETNKIQFLLERNLTRNLKLTWNFWSLAQNREFDIENNDKLYEDDLIGTVGPTFELDYRNNPLVTSSGTYSKLDIQFADPLLASSWNISFLQTSGNFNWYVPAKFLNLVWANSIGGGYLANLRPGNENFLPDIVIFKLGGRDTIRGFDPLSIPGKDRFDRVVRVLTDSHYYLFKSEFRVPIFGQFETVLFYDGGAVKTTGVDLRDEYRDAAGVGIRYVTPAGPLRFDYGYKLDRYNKSEKQDFFHIAFGIF